MNGFYRPSLDTKIFKKRFTDSVKTENAIAFTRTTIATRGTTPIKFYDCNGDTYAYCSDKKIRKVEGMEFSVVNFTSNVIPIVISVKINGAMKVMFVSDETATIDGETVSGIPYGVAAAFCGGRLFIADGYKIKYSEEFDYTDFSVGLNFGGFIEIDRNEGEILYVAEDGGKLYVITEHAVFALSPYGEPFEFKMEKLTDFGLSIVKNTVFGVGGTIGFLNGNTFCALSGGRIKFLSDALTGYTNMTVGVAGGHCGFYVLPFTIDRVNYAFVYDFVSGKEALENVSGYAVAGEYAAKTTDIRFYRITVITKTVSVADEYSAEYDFGTCRKKAVSRVEAHVTGSATIVVRGDGVFRATITEKCNSVSCFLHGRSFYIGFENASADFKAENIAVHYTIYGD